MSLSSRISIVDLKEKLPTVREFQSSFRTEIIVQRYDDALISLVHQHSMTLAESASSDILARNSHITTFEKKRTESHSLLKG